MESASDVAAPSRGEVAARFESLGGGSNHANGWAYGCEFGFYQRWAKAEPLGLLRWASVSPSMLLAGLRASFDGVGEPGNIELREDAGQDWGVTQTTYSLRIDHSHLMRSEVAESAARMTMARTFGFLRTKLVEDLADGQKVFVYRMISVELPDEQVAEIAAAVNSFGKNTFLFVREHNVHNPSFTVDRKSSGFMVGYIDRFAPKSGGLEFNHDGWDRLCRVVLETL